jgi:glucose-6-phosphate 1-epimerase
VTSLIEQLKLRIIEQRDHAVFIAENNKGQRFFWVDHPLAKALIAEQGAHLISYIPVGYPEQLWISRDSLYEPGKAIRGGVPICWPWFGKLGTPSHGFARISNWTLNSCRTDDSCVVLDFELTHEMVDNSPFPFQVNYRITIGRQLTLSLTSKNTGLTDMPITGALHTYFAMKRDQACVYGLGEHYQDSLQSGKACRETEFTLEESTDRIYTDTDQTLLMHHDKQRTRISHYGNDSVVVWCVSPEQVASMADMHAGADKEYLCVEAAITQQPVMIEPGISYLLEQQIIPE